MHREEPIKDRVLIITVPGCVFATCLSLPTQECPHAYKHVHIYTCIHTFLYAHIYACTCRHKGTQAYMCAGVHEHTHTHPYTQEQVSISMQWLQIIPSGICPWSH